ncbi:flagellar export protein FliJ [candidate division LCP-89 bacterium B3_LCP]|uniref:Flagellar FliJ protein n=1 Tax=candidate division LCP-89 bacterium B3_LCP TaxID=2012998 RepID=A0A532V4X6_UNCL8|nr:MAG: flagellar export protein FliJ [candidate division LCP-89 bacterium B3_LCP]
MKKFIFRLQRVAEIRKKKEKECQRDFALSMDELNRQEELLSHEEGESEKSHQGLHRALEKGHSAGELTTLDGWRTRKLKMLDDQIERTEKQRQEVEVKRKGLLQATKEKKILEKLKERRKAEHQISVQREERLFLDELGCRSKSSPETPHIETVNVGKD